ncbi:hypothetical protein [Bifidobacterium longum]|uniref:hypothetical protein n=1 Tax=Bifidobacterium longum TaxID=216816 RepID=UPI001D006904|nr:hypothetical protein [Bifidobacterium longum]
MPKVVVVGDANVDIIVPYPRFLNEERTQVEYPQIGIEEEELGEHGRGVGEARPGCIVRGHRGR